MHFGTGLFMATLSGRETSIASAPPYRCTSGASLDTSHPNDRAGRNLTQIFWSHHASSGTVDPSVRSCFALLVVAPLLNEVESAPGYP